MGALAFRLYYAILVLTIFASTSYSQKSKPLWLNYYPSLVTLNGTPVKKWAYGPPGFGENPKTDMIEHYLVLKLNRPVNVQADTSDTTGLDDVTETDVKEIELRGGDSTSWAALISLIGKEVSVKGWLFHGATGNDHTNILMNFREIVSPVDIKVVTLSDNIPAEYEADKDFIMNFQCPESLENKEAKDAAAEAFLRYCIKNHPNWSIDQTLTFRMFLLQYKGCMETLGNIQKNTEEEKK